MEQQRDDGDDNLDIQEIWVDDPANHVELGKIKWYRKQETLEIEARSVFDLGDTNLMELIDKLVDDKRLGSSNLLQMLMIILLNLIYLQMVRTDKRYWSDCRLLFGFGA